MNPANEENEEERLDINDLDDEAFFNELKRRSQEADDDPSVLIPWSEVKRMVYRIGLQ